MCAKSSPMGTPPSERSRSATENEARGDSTCCARRPRQLAGERRKNRERGIAIASILPDVAARVSGFTASFSLRARGARLWRAGPRGGDRRGVSRGGLHERQAALAQSPRGAGRVESGGGGRL